MKDRCLGCNSHIQRICSELDLCLQSNSDTEDELLTELDCRSITGSQVPYGERIQPSDIQIPALPKPIRFTPAEAEQIKLRMQEVLRNRTG